MFKDSACYTVPSPRWSWLIDHGWVIRIMRSFPHLLHHYAERSIGPHPSFSALSMTTLMGEAVLAYRSKLIWPSIYLASRTNILYLIYIASRDDLYHWFSWRFSYQFCKVYRDFVMSPCIVYSFDAAGISFFDATLFEFFSWNWLLFICQNEMFPCLILAVPG